MDPCGGSANLAAATVTILSVESTNIKLASDNPERSSWDHELGRGQFFLYLALIVR